MNWKLLLAERDRLDDVQAAKTTLEEAEYMAGERPFLEDTEASLEWRVDDSGGEYILAVVWRPAPLGDGDE